MELLQKIKSMPRLKKIIKWISLSLLLFTIVGFFVLPPILKSVLVKKLSEGLHREVTLQSIRVNPYMLSVDIKGFAVKDRNGQETFISFDELYLNFQSIRIIQTK